MSSDPQEMEETGNFIAFDKSNNGDNRGGGGGYRQNFQYRPYHRQQNNRNPIFRRNHQQHQQFGIPQYQQHGGGDSQFAPANYSSPVHQQQRFDSGYRHRPNQMNQFRRNFVSFNVIAMKYRCKFQIFLIVFNCFFLKKFGGNSNHHSNASAPIQQYFHKSMLEDPWADCDQFNGRNERDSPPNVPTTDELNDE